MNETGDSKRVWPTQDWERTYTTWTHLTFAAGLVPGVNIPSMVLTLVLWLIKRDKSWYIDDHGKEAMNAQITWLIYAFAMWIMFLTVALIPLALALWGIGAYSGVRAAFAASRGQMFRYPMCLRFIR